MNIYHLPEKLKQLALKRRKEYVEKERGSFNDELQSAFIYAHTPEGHAFWEFVTFGNFEKARKIYDWEMNHNPNHLINVITDLKRELDSYE